MMENKIEKAQSYTIEHTDTAPVDMIAYAIQQGASVETIEKMWELKKRNEEYESMKEFNQAISAFRTECPVIKKTREAYSSKYAGLAETIEQIKPLLSKHGLSHRWSTSQNNGDITVQCTVAHRSGHSESTSLTAKADTSGSKNSIQAIGSTASYLERYTLYAILGLASSDMDDDAQSAERNPDDYMSENQIAEMTALIDEVRGDATIDEYTERFVKWAGYDTIEDIPRVKYKNLIAALEKKRGAK